MAASKGPTIRLQSGPGDGWQFHEDDFMETDPRRPADGPHQRRRPRLGARLPAPRRRLDLGLARRQLLARTTRSLIRADSVRGQLSRFANR